VKSAGEGMRPERGILDASAVIAMADTPVDRLPRVTLITTVTLAELSVGPLLAKSEQVRSVRQGNLQVAEASFEALPFDAAAARAFGGIAASLRRTGRRSAARAYDTMIAATAVANDLPLFTCNPDDFRGIDGLEVIPVPAPT
jgi:tRNA(fMet)-specific endonuclease VapC